MTGVAGARFLVSPGVCEALGCGLILVYVKCGNDDAGQGGARGPCSQDPLTLMSGSPLPPRVSRSRVPAWSLSHGCLPPWWLATSCVPAGRGVRVWDELPRTATVWQSSRGGAHRSRTVMLWEGSWGV